MKRALNEFIVEGVKTTIPFHQRLLEDPNFVDGTKYTTTYLDTLKKEGKM